MESFGSRQVKALKSLAIYDTINVDGQECVIMPKAVLEFQHRNMISQVHELRKLLGYKQLGTGKQVRNNVRG